MAHEVLSHLFYSVAIPLEFLLLNFHDILGEKPYVCSYPFSQKAHREIGFDQTHVICGARFRRSDELTRHRRRHDDTRPFVCPHCERSFRRSDHCRVHVRVHCRARRTSSKGAVGVDHQSHSDSPMSIACNNLSQGYTVNSPVRYDPPVMLKVDCTEPSAYYPTSSQSSSVSIAFGQTQYSNFGHPVQSPATFAWLSDANDRQDDVIAVGYHKTCINSSHQQTYDVSGFCPT